ncbi:MAG TPA: AmmeMemoRadiSam system protein A [Chloroflexota bacterium]|nr:AmmeMemoRadiSam system protein A [Chloroflexota bacterium]
MIKSAPPFQLTPEQQQLLLRMARDAITQWVEHGRVPHYQNDDPALAQAAGVFVTLRHHQDGELALRGCIGRVEAPESLLQLVPEMAVKAATSDPRFPPVATGELPGLHIEISVLSPLQRLADIHDIAVGAHGLLIEAYGRRGLLLPEVPLHHGWNRADFLEGICLKAGLPPNTWQDPQARLYIFTTFSFEEEIAD